MVRRTLTALLALVLLLGLAACGAANEAATTAADAGTTLKSDLQGLIDNQLAKIDTAADSGDFAAAKAEFEEVDETWERIEDGVKAASADAYENIETALEGLEDAVVRANAPDAATIKQAADGLRQQLAAFITTL